ncbi:MAG: hypothetical protein JWR52_3642 [Marmoricola sp.]|nr:hypothetical protein [Marmoricola sp.]
MSDLISRTRRDASRPGEPGRPLSASAALGGVMAAAVSLVLCMALALTAWFLADAGAHGTTTDALRVGAGAWLVGHGSHVTLAGLPLGMIPLGLTMGLVLTAFRSGRWAARNAVPVTDDRVLAGAVATFTGSYVVLAVVICLGAGTSGASPSLSRTVLGAILVAGLGGGAGLAVGTGRFDARVDSVPTWVRELVVGAFVGAFALLAAGALLVMGSLLFSFNEAATILSDLHLGTGDALTYTFVMALLSPNAALLGSSYLLGPGFAIGAGTTVSPTAMSLGAIPAFPLLAALPHEGPTPGWLAIFMGVPALCAAVGVAKAHRSSAPLPFDLAALRGAGAGFGAGVLITIAISLAGGPMGTGRMADIGAHTAEILVFATGTMSLGGLLGGVFETWWLRRGART